MSANAIPVAPKLHGVPEAHTLRDAYRMSWWSLRGFCYGISHGDVAARVLSLIFAGVQGASIVVQLGPLIQWGLFARPRARYYMSPSRDAVLCVVAGRNGWKITDHVAARPGKGRGKVLRDLVIDPLTAAADASCVAVSTTAANQTLAKEYMKEVRGMSDVGRGRPRGRKLHRPPKAIVLGMDRPTVP